MALAGAIAEEDRSAAIHARASELLAQYAMRTGLPSTPHLGSSLTSNLAFIRSLQSMSDTAAGAHQDAREQAEFQMRTLAAAETKMRAGEDRVGQEKQALAQLRERREVPPELTTPAKMARKLHNGEGPPGQLSVNTASDPEP